MLLRLRSSNPRVNRRRGAGGVPSPVLNWAMPKKKRAKIGNRRAKGGKKRTKADLAARASLITPLPKAPDAVNTVPPSPKRRRAAIVAEGKITSDS